MNISQPKLRSEKFNDDDDDDDNYNDVYDDDDDDDDDNNNNHNHNNNVKRRVIPVIIGATGTISKSFRKYISDIPGNHEVKELQKTAILGTSHILRKVLT